eukprot:TRINITY_DN10941_c0_g1_i1.p2 TRINITY_DN10941_c0_g1~~TRINITY_DN10941_c0_g1_i1.p2  ORF type:complete len:340 (+),score=99.27 TRINITY_DN10941_c0_g1_i1:106-1125(+)
MGTCTSRLRCGKCDGPHLDDDCRVFTKPREDHPDAKPGRGPDTQPEALVQGCREVRQPPDNNCLFHCLAAQLDNGTSHVQLRRILSRWIAEHPDLEVTGGRKLRELAREDYPEDSAERYSSAIASSPRWGGQPELNACAHAYGVDIRVWQRRRKSHCLISHIKAPDCPVGTVDVVFDPRRQHYDELRLPAHSPEFRPKPKGAVLRPSAPQAQPVGAGPAAPPPSGVPAAAQPAAAKRTSAPPSRGTRTPQSPQHNGVSAPLAPGAAVVARYGAEWWLATVRDLRPGGTVDVDWADGTISSGLPPADVHAAESPEGAALLRSGAVKGAQPPSPPQGGRAG